MSQYPSAMNDQSPVINLENPAKWLNATLIIPVFGIQITKAVIGTTFMCINLPLLLQMKSETKARHWPALHVIQSIPTVHSKVHAEAGASDLEVPWKSVKTGKQIYYALDFTMSQARGHCLMLNRWVLKIIMVLKCFQIMRGNISRTERLTKMHRPPKPDDH